MTVDESASRARLRHLYTGRSRDAARFRYGLIALDILTIGFFILTAPLQPTPAIIAGEVLIGLIILLDLSSRLWISPDRWRTLRQVYTLADLIVVASLVLAPLLGQSLAFLKVLRALRLVHSYHVLRDLRRDTVFFREHEDTILAAVNLFVFIFVSAAIVFVLRSGDEPGMASFIDALYFTIATLTTTGYGDIVMTTPGGRLLSAAMMIIGVALFFRLARALFLPRKVHHTCRNCGLDRHETDAIHCKHCGEDLKIRTHGAE